MEGYQTHARFETTQWRLVDELRGPDPACRARALEALVGRYWPPVYATLRRMGRRPDEAAEITQGFFADVVLGRGLFEQARGERGRLRTLLLTSLTRYQIDRQRRAAARGAGRVFSLEGAELAREERIVAAADGLAPEVAFERRWALAHLEEALRRCESHFLSHGRAGHWALFEARVLRPSISATTPPPLAQLAVEHGFRTGADAAAAVQVVKKRLMAVLREVIAEAVADPAEQEEELGLVLGLNE